MLKGVRNNHAGADWNRKKIACTPIHSGSIFQPAKPGTLVYQGVNSFSGFVVVAQIAIV